MKILVCIGSYRKHGNTDQVVGRIVEHLQAEAERCQTALEVETIYLGHQQIGPCRGCRACFERGEARCPLKDDMPEIKVKMQATDGILVATPVYVDDVSGLTKTWIDRLAYVCHRPEFAGKCAYLVATVGSSPVRHTLQTLELAFSTWGFTIAGKTGFKTGALMKPEALAAQYQEKTRQVAQRFFQSIHQRDFARPSFRALMTFKIQQQFWQKLRDQPEQKTGLSNFELDYWQERGWLEPRTDFYITHESSRVKVALARLMGRVIAKFVI